MSALMEHKLQLERLLRLYTEAPNALWRHDVDVSLDAAARMARFAQLAGVRCTFAIMARSEFYNPMSYQSRRAIYEILDYGHRLVPHVHYRADDSASIYEVVEEERWFWANCFPGMFDTEFVAFHMPPPVVLWNDYRGMGDHKGFEHAHASKWRDRYLSDSRREWTAEKEARVSDGMQIALHPEYWFGYGADA